MLMPNDDVNEDGENGHCRSSNGREAKKISTLISKQLATIPSKFSSTK